MNFSRIGVSCFLATYAIVFGLECLRMMGRSQINRALILVGGILGLAAHTVYILVRSSAAQLPPLLSSSHDWLLVLAWLAVLSYLFLTTLDRDLAVGVFLLPVVLILISATYFVSDTANHRLDSLYGWKMLHASLLVLGMLGVLVGFVLAMMYLFQQRRLKHHQLTPEGFGLPNLEKLARLNRWSVMIAVPLLTFGMGTGVGLGIYAKLAKTTTDAVPFYDPMIIGSGVAWLVMFALFVWLMTTRRTTGKQVASLTLWAAGFLLFTLLGLQVATGKKLFELKTWHVQSVRPNNLMRMRPQFAGACSCQTSAARSAPPLTKGGQGGLCSLCALESTSVLAVISTLSSFGQSGAVRVPNPPCPPFVRGGASAVLRTGCTYLLVTGGRS